jgi:DNA-binding transcriptional LysR family regulator
LPELMQSRLVAVQYVSEFSLGLREMALLHQGAAWLPRSLVAQELKQGRLQELPAIGLEVPLSIKTYFATHGNQALQDLFAKFKASQDSDQVEKA